MHSHGPSCLEGPVSRHRKGWGKPPAGIVPPSGREKRNMNSSEPTQQPEERPIRWDLVERVRREIEAGTYDTPEKMEVALDRLLQRLNKD